MSEGVYTTGLVDYWIHKFARKLATAFPKYQADFEMKWSAWRNAISTSSDSSTWSGVPQFQELLYLGPKIVPLVLAKMDGSDATAGVFLYNKIETDLAYRIEADDLDITAQVDKIRHKNFIRNRAVRNALLDWEDHCDMAGRFSSSTLAFTLCEDYFELVKFGVCIVPQLMLQYGKLRHDAHRRHPIFGHEALHEVIWGYPCEFEEIIIDTQCKDWVEWFENEDYIQAPHYKRKQDRPPRFPPLSDEEDSE
ncbi:hypothetical protein QBC35DRAFT_504125 [Podospora australis]|uniref:Uncharacterized protein n=1 Tax=Podospora australis TaxID=1536484 RepID=A0AAN7AE52_9PEZI|nr:hypothetical protein QBC35DRAFT_504125 [Podospora australis]